VCVCVCVCVWGMERARSGRTAEDGDRVCCRINALQENPNTLFDCFVGFQSIFIEQFEPTSLFALCTLFLIAWNAQANTDAIIRAQSNMDVSIRVDRSLQTLGPRFSSFKRFQPLNFAAVDRVSCFVQIRDVRSELKRELRAVSDPQIRGILVHRLRIWVDFQYRCVHRGFRFILILMGEQGSFESPNIRNHATGTERDSAHCICIFISVRFLRGSFLFMSPDSNQYSPLGSCASREHCVACSDPRACCPYAVSCAAGQPGLLSACPRTGERFPSRRARISAAH
jgi:hypothetical protein